jgi:Do/DeqQ family serine protease
MKKTVLLSAMVSLLISGLVIVTYHFTTAPEEIMIRHIESIPGYNVRFETGKSEEVLPMDFTHTTKKVLDAVVHVKAIGKSGSEVVNPDSYRELPDPFRDFFRDSPFGNYFDKRQYFNEPDQKNNESQRPMPLIGTGSGVIINDKGYIVTNNHVIENADEIEVTLHDNGSYKATVIGTDPSTDLALLQIKANNLKSLALVNSDDVKVGEWVLAVGNPFSLNSTVTAGIVSAKARNININKDRFAVESFIQTDAAINPGNSGGALVNLNGDLVGINTAIASRTGTYNGYGFAVPSNIVSKVVEDLLNYGYVQRGILGINIVTMNSQLAMDKDIEFTQGVYVAGINDGSGAQEAGLKVGDVIVGLDDKRIKSSPVLQEMIARRHPGDQVKVKFLRDGKEETATVVLKSQTGMSNLEKKEHRELYQMLGAELETLDKKKSVELGLKGGVRVSKLYPGKLRQQTKIRQGFIITRVNSRQIRNTDELMKELEGREGGVMLEGIYEDLPGVHFYAFGI